MSLMTKTQIENLTDSLAAQIDAFATGCRNAAETALRGSLFVQVDAVDDPEIENALSTAANTHDERLRSTSSWIRDYLGATMGPLLGSLNAQVAADGTLTPATFNTYLSDAGAQVAPEIQTLAPSGSALGTTLSPANVFSPAIASGAFDKVYGGADGALVDLSTDAADAGTADVALFENDDDALYLKWRDKPLTASEYLSFALSTVATEDVGLQIEYWNGTAWVALLHTDADTTGTYANAGTKGFTQSGVIKFAVPTNWKRCYKNPDGDPIKSDDLTPGFYLRLSRTADVVATTPVASMLRRGIGLGLVIVTAADTCTFVAGEGVDTTLYDAVNKLKLLALTNISANVTATVEYTRRDATTGRSAAQAAWTAIDAGDEFPAAADSYLSLQSADEGVQAVTDVSVSTTATSGLFILESRRERELSK